MNEEKIARINELFHKSKAEGLTPAEKEEQQKLRKEYIEAIRGNMRDTLDHTSIQNEDGTLTPLRIVRQQNLAKKNEDTLYNTDQVQSDNVESIDEIKKKKLIEQKIHIRKELTEKRNALSPREVKQRSGIICYHVLQSEQYKNSSAICVYEAFRNEINCEDIIEQAYEDEKEVYVPVVDMDNKTMDFYKITPDTSWTESSYGIKEPVITKDTGKLSPDNEALVIMPGLAFDKNKHRIGYGGGYYDKYLAEHTGYIKMALCYSFQVLNEDLPYDKEDVIPDYIVTEDGII